SARARAKVRHWFKYQNFEENVSQGRAKLDKELHRLGIGAINHEALAQKLHFNKLEEFLAAIGRGDVTPHQIAQAIQEDEAPKPAQPRPATRPAVQESASGILLEGVGNVLSNTAKCCKPVSPEPIVGYVTRDRGVTVHRQNCAFIARLPEDRRARLLAAQWGSAGAQQHTAVDIEVEAIDRQGLLRDITDLLAQEHVNVTRTNTQSKHHQARMRFSIEVSDLDQLSRVLALLGKVRSVTLARRC
ncbi:guanosine-3',5'-bis(diphosphate) 3'-pyrophosphohydrolase, putative, partial [Ricinus communis]